MRWSVWFLATVLAIQSAGCSFVAPAAIPPVASSFQNTGADGSTNVSHVSSAESCAGRLNAHRSAALAAYYIRTIFIVLGAILAGGGGGGGLTSILSDNPDTQAIGGWVALIGGGVSVFSTAFGLVLDDPTNRLELRGRAVPYFNLALSLADELRDGGLTDVTIRRAKGRELATALRACIDDGSVPAGGPGLRPFVF